MKPLLGTALLAALAWIGLGGGAENVEQYAEAHRPAAMYPDYSGTVIPPNLAPMNLQVLEQGRKFRLRVSAAAGPPLEVFDTGGDMRIPLKAWRKLLDANRGGDLRMDIYAFRAPNESAPSESPEVRRPEDRLARAHG